LLHACLNCDLGRSLRPERSSTQCALYKDPEIAVRRLRVRAHVWQMLVAAPLPIIELFTYGWVKQ